MPKIELLFPHPYPQTSPAPPCFISVNTSTHAVAQAKNSRSHVTNIQMECQYQYQILIKLNFLKNKYKYGCNCFFLHHMDHHEHNGKHKPRSLLKLPKWSAAWDLAFPMPSFPLSSCTELCKKSNHVTTLPPGLDYTGPLIHDFFFFR